MGFLGPGTPDLKIEKFRKLEIGKLEYNTQILLI